MEGTTQILSACCEESTAASHSSPEATVYNSSAKNWTEKERGVLTSSPMLVQLFTVPEDVATFSAIMQTAATVTQLVLLTMSLIMGVFGNSMTIVIIGTRFRGLQTGRSISSSDRFLLLLAVASLVFDLTTILGNVVGSVNGFRIHDYHDVTCKLFHFLANASAAVAWWLMVALAWQRALLVLWPHRVQSLCTPKRSSHIIAFIVAFFCLAYSHMLYGYTVLPGTTICRPAKPEYDAFIKNVWVYVDQCIYFFLPYVLLILASAILIIKLRESLLEGHLVNVIEQRVNRKRKAKSVTLTTITISVALVALCTPMIVTRILSTRFPQVRFPDCRSRAEVVVQYFYVVSYCITTFTCSFIFYAYCLTGARFRNEFLRFFGRKGAGSQDHK